MQDFLPTTIQGQSPWHRMDARWKLVAVVINLLVLPWVRSLEGTLLASLCSLGFLLSTGVPRHWWLPRVGMVAGFLVLFVIVLPFTVGQQDTTFLGITFSSRGLVLSLIIFFRGLAAVCWTLFLTATTSTEQLLHAATALHLPQPILRVMVVTWRYIQVMYHTIRHFRTALRLRGFRNRPGWRTYQTITSVIGTLLVQGFDHTERAVHAMQARGYRGRIITLVEWQNSSRDVTLFLMMLLYNGVLII
ncbi:MAG TPA: cobalt ECF transporter T component CbiQ [Gemmatales bacterium]|nr:cobalt ECF transporter T component CbiQ [Gemmatales bacterium]